MIALVETALFKIKKSAGTASLKNIHYISMNTSQIDFDALCRYIRLSIGLKNICQTEDSEANIYPNKDIAPFIPLFILKGSESDSALIMRLATLGLSLSEIDDILEAISLENNAHIRRVGKTRLFCKAQLQRRLSEDYELRMSAEKRSKLLPKFKSLFYDPNIEELPFGAILEPLQAQKIDILQNLKTSGKAQTSPLLTEHALGSIRPPFRKMSVEISHHGANLAIFSKPNKTQST